MPVPADASGPMFMRRQDVVVHAGDNGPMQHLGYRVKILHSNALQLGNLSILWNPAAGTPTVHAITVYRDGETIDVLKAAAFEVLRRENQLEAAQLDGTLTAVLRVPDLRVGDELEVAVTVPGSDPTLGNKAVGALVMAPTPMPGRYRLGLNWAEGHSPKVKVTPDMAAAMQRGDHRIDVRFDNPAALTPPKDAPLRYQWQRAIEYSDFADWPAVSRHFAPFYTRAARLADTSPVKREASRIAAAHADPHARAAAALKLVQQDIRYIYVGMNGGNLTPASADETWARRYGDCKGKTALLLALLNEMGIEAQAVLVNANGADDALDQRLPMPQYFDHVVVRATIDGAQWWMDGTLPPVVPPAREPIMPLRQVLPLTQAGATIEGLPWRPAAVPDEISLYEIDATAGFDKPARIRSTSILRGAKALQQQVQFSSLSPAQLTAAFRQELTGNTWDAIDDVRWRYDQDAAASVVEISGTGTVDWDDDGDGVRSTALPGGGVSPPEKRSRAREQDQVAPYQVEAGYSCYVTTVRLPRETDARHWSAKPDYSDDIFGRHYYRAFELRDGAIRMVRSSRAEATEITAAQAVSDNGRIVRFDNSMGWITYDPSVKQPAMGSGRRVPATFEIDWTAPDVPCLAMKKAGT